jgi:hypothetical protein
MKPILLFPLSDEALTELDDLYRTTRDVRIRTTEVEDCLNELGIP